jgi:hypothetical protein
MTEGAAGGILEKPAAGELEMFAGEQALVYGQAATRL